MLDRRYGNSSIRNKLPKWISGELKVADSYGQMMKDLGAFYRQKRV